jgi:hypothetical protein
MLQSCMYSSARNVHAKLWRDRGTSARVVDDLLAFFDFGESLHLFVPGGPISHQRLGHLLEVPRPAARSCFSVGLGTSFRILFYLRNAEYYCDNPNAFSKE